MNLVKRESSKPTKRMVRRYQPSYSLVDEISKMLDFAYSPWSGFGLRRPDYISAPKLDMKDEGSHYSIEVEVPGYKEDALNISVDGNQLIVTGKYSNESESEDSNKYLIKEKVTGSFTRTVQLPEGADTETISAFLDSGMLYIQVPKNLDTVSPKTIKIETK